MALVAKGVSGWMWSCTLMDTQGDLSTLTYELNAADLTEANAIADLLYAELVLLSGSQIVATKVSYSLEENAVAFPTGADNSVRARLSFQLANSTKKATLDIPAPVQALFVDTTGPNNNVVDTTNTNLQDFLAVFQSSPGALMSDGEQADFVLSGRRVSISRGISRR